jgi:molybdopterin-binding protein
VIAVLKVSQAAQLLGVSDDTVRRWISDGRLKAKKPRGGPMTIDGKELARFAQELAASHDSGERGAAMSARNRLTGIVTRILSDTVMSQVELQVGQHRLVALISTEAVTELGLEPGALATASVKATNVVIEVPDHP